MRFPNFTEEETILVLDLFLRNRDEATLQGKDERVIKLSGILREIYHRNYPQKKLPDSLRSPASIVFKLRIYKKLDQSVDYSHSKIDKLLWKKYRSRPISEINNEANIIKESYGIGEELLRI